MINGSEYHYVVNTSAFSKGSKKGMLSKDKVTIKGRVGNSLIVKSDNPNLDGKIIPYRNLIKAGNPEEKRSSSRLLSSLFSKLDKIINLDKIIAENKPKIIKPNKARELRQLGVDI